MRLIDSGKALFGAGLLWACVSPVFAAPLFVNGNTGSDSGNDCASAGSPCATIQRAIDSAQAGDTIEIADATYTEMVVVDKALAMRGQSRAGTVIQAAESRGVANNRVISVDDDTDFELSDATIRHGRAGVGPGSGGDDGGGLECLGGDLLLERVTFTANDAEGAGAGLASGDNVVVMNDVVFRGNGNSDTSEGGGAFLGENFVITDATLTNVVFENNMAAGVGGGLSIFNIQAALRTVIFVENSADNGGGLYYEGSGDSNLELRNVAFVGNSAGSDGGGMLSVTSGTPYSMVNVLFSGNSANLGGALFNSNGLDEGSRVLTNVTISGNRATLRGGGIDRPFGMVLRNTIIWNNQDETGIGTAEANLRDRFRNAVVEVSNSLLQGYLPDVWPGSNNLDGTDAGNNPLFRDAVNPNGAPSLAGDLRLQFESPVRDVGNNSFVTGITTDLDGNPRIVGGTVDLGAFEGDDLLFGDGFEDTGLIR